MLVETIQEFFMEYISKADAPHTAALQVSSSKLK